MPAHNGHGAGWDLGSGRSSASEAAEWRREIAGVRKAGLETDGVDMEFSGTMCGDQLIPTQGEPFADFGEIFAIVEGRDEEEFAG